MQRKLKVAGFQDLTVLVAEIPIQMVTRTQQMTGYHILKDSQMHSRVILRNGMILTVMVSGTISNGLMDKHGAWLIEETVVELLLENQHSIDGVAQIQMEMGGPTRHPTGSQVPGVWQMHGLMIPLNGMIQMEMAEETILQVQLLTFAQLIQEPQLDRVLVETDGAVQIPMVMDGQT
jgi:hypothetical protein